MKRNSDIIIVVICIILFTGVGYFAGKWRKPEVVVIDTHKIDSLLYVTQTLEDSIRILDARRETVYRERVKYRTKYDTLKIAPSDAQLIHNLRIIGATPIE